MQETLTEIDAATIARRQKALLYEQLTNERQTLGVTIARLTLNRFAVTALRRIQELTAEVPETLVTRSQRFVPGGFNVREVLQTIASDALADAQLRADKNQRQLDAATARLAEVDKELAGF